MLFDKDIKDSTLIHIPHAGTTIPSLAGYVVPIERIEQEIMLLTDLFTDRLFDVPGVGRLICPWSRVYCDVERFLEGEDMERFGMGFFYTHCDDGTLLRQDKDGAKLQASLYYKAHHQALEREVSRRVRDHGVCHIVDAHSFSEKPFRRDTNQDVPRPDICLGTTEKNTPGYILDYFRIAFEKAGLSVKVNQPYSGSMVPAIYVGDASVTSIMIEINRKLYLREGHYDPHVNEIITEALSFSHL